MRKFEKKITIGTKVLINANGRKVWDKVKEVDETKQWVKLQEWQGRFQRKHIEKYSNK